MSDQEAGDGPRFGRPRPVEAVRASATPTSYGHAVPVGGRPVQ